jgi:hypothetical protein
MKQQGMKRSAASKRSTERTPASVCMRAAPAHIPSNRKGETHGWHNDDDRTGRA